jgi:hypothetical protein
LEDNCGLILLKEKEVVPRISFHLHQLEKLLELSEAVPTEEALTMQSTQYLVLAVRTPSIIRLVILHQHIALHCLRLSLLHIGVEETLAEGGGGGEEAVGGLEGGEEKAPEELSDAAVFGVVGSLADLGIIASSFFELSELFVAESTQINEM